MGWDVIIHSSAGILSLVLGAMMVLDVFPWATDAFSIMMVIAFVSSVLISWWTSSWVRGHFLAMAPIIGIALGYLGVPFGKFLHFIIFINCFHFAMNNTNFMTRYNSYQ